MNEVTKTLGAIPTQEALPEEIMQDLEKIKLPYVLKKKILMSPGTWNGVNYSPETIFSGFKNTDFTNKEISSLFINHSDKDVGSWVGMVTNAHIDGQNIIGDLNIVDKPTAIKLAFGAKFGVSPKVSGLYDETTSKMQNFGFNNFSIVIDPAVKTAYINNSNNQEVNILEQVTAMEEKRKSLGMSPAEFYAIPKDPPSESKLPIFDAAHVRNALARVNQVEGVSADEKAKALDKIKSAAKKFGIETEEKKMEELSETLINELKESYKAFKADYMKTHPEATDEECMKAYKNAMMPEKDHDKDHDVPPKKGEEKTKMMSESMKEKEEKTEEKPAQTTPPAEIVTADKIVGLEQRLAKLEKQKASPERLTQELGEESDAPQSSGDVDVDMMGYLKKVSGY